MQAYELAEFAALIAINGGPFLRDVQRLSDSGIQQYWSASRCRFDRWSEVLTVGRHEGESQGQIEPVAWREAAAVMEELFMSGMLTRIWTAIACEHDSRQGRSYVSPVVRSILLGQLEARNRALNLMYLAHEHRWADVADLNRLRSKAERWTDLLLAHIAADCSVDELAFDLQRVRDFAEDLHDGPRPLDCYQMWRIMQASLNTAFRANSRRASPNSDLNQRIASAILASFPPDLFDSKRLRRAVWMDRLNLIANDAQAMVDELISLDRARSRRRPFAEGWLAIGDA